jgi:outer membrane lipoprotein SlyB
MNTPVVSNAQSLLMTLFVRVVIVIGFFSGTVAIAAIMDWLFYPGSSFANAGRWEDRSQENLWLSSALPQPFSVRSGAVAVCGRCGIVEASRTVIAKSESDSDAGRAVGTLIGLHAGGVREIGMIIGAVAGGAVAKKMKATPQSEVTVRLGDGSILVVRDKHPARWEPGDRVKVVGGVLRKY